MQQRPHLAKQTIDEHQLNKLNKTTQSKTDKLSHSGKLAYINDDYCEITRNYTSFYGMNILGVVLFLPVAILCFGAVLFFSMMRYLIMRDMLKPGIPEQTINF